MGLMAHYKVQEKKQEKSTSFFGKSLDKLYFVPYRSMKAQYVGFFPSWEGIDYEMPLLRKSGQQGNRFAKCGEWPGNKAEAGMQAMQKEVHYIREIRAIPRSRSEEERRQRAL
jgi:hypothetical protein